MSNLEINKYTKQTLRFSGTEIYNEPFRCARDIVEYGDMKLKELIKNGNLQDS